jgi:pantoate--beta-alanine ligase
MKIARTIADARKYRHEQDGTWGFVPTMGALHRGHLSLIERAREENERVAVSIFVNPTQFAAGGDFDKYPRPLEHDLSLLEARGVNLVFVPDREEMYPRGFQTYVTVEDVAKPLEGTMRPGHFRGVGAVVATFLKKIHPDPPTAPTLGKRTPNKSRSSGS